MKKVKNLVGAVPVIGLLCTLCLVSTSVLAQVVSVDATATGRFGNHPAGDPPPGADMISGFVFTGPGSVGISATGLIDLTNAVPLPPNAVLNVPPDGVAPINRLSIGLGPNLYFPLEEAFVEIFGIGALPADVSDAGDEAPLMAVNFGNAVERVGESGVLWAKRPLY